MNLESVLKVVQGWVKIKGATDGTFIGNEGDRLRVTGASSDASPGCPVFTKKLRYEFTEPTTVLTASYQTVFLYSGSGKFIGINLDADKNDITVKFTVDSTDVIFEIASTDLNNVQAAGAVRGVGLGGLGWDTTGHRFLFEPLCDIEYQSEVKVEAKKVGGPPVTLNRILVALTKET